MVDKSCFRSDTHLRHTSTSTSNYNSTSDVPSYLRGFEQEERRSRRRERGIGDNDHAAGDDMFSLNLLRRWKWGFPTNSNFTGRERGDSDSDSDGSEGRSLDLASSHSSDDDESSSRRHHSRSHISRYLHISWKRLKVHLFKFQLLTAIWAIMTLFTAALNNLVAVLEIHVLKLISNILRLRVFRECS